MHPKNNLNSLLIIGMSVLLITCKENNINNDYLLKEESRIIEKMEDNIHDFYKKMAEAEKDNKLQAQLDLQREINNSILEINSALKKCQEQYKTGKLIPFMQNNKEGQFAVKEIKLIGCQFNEEIMDFEIHMTAEVVVMDSRNDLLLAELLDAKGETLVKIKFLLTNNYPEKGKTITLFAHTKGFNTFKSFTKIVFN